MRALSYIEIDVPRCSLSYGVGACPAVLGVDSAIKCHNSIGSCPVRASFDEELVTLRFAVPADYLPREVEAWPNIANIGFTPAIISLGKDLGTRSTLKVTFEDHPWADTGPLFDKYLGERPYDPWRTGSFWAKFRARNPSLRGRAMRWIQGLAGQSIDEMDVRHFLVEGYEGPDDSGRTTIVAKDALRMADGDRAQAPLLSPGRLNASILAGASSATLAPSGVGNASYPASGYLNIGGKEIVAFTRSGDALTLTRAQFNTEAQDHSAGDRLQLCLHYNAVDPADIIADLLTNYAGVDSALIPLAAWQAETAAHYRRVNTALIAEPTPVKTLVSELIEQDALALWWDDEERRLRLQVLRAIATDAELFVDGPGGNIVAGTLQVRVQDDKRISRVWTYFGQLNPLKGVSDPDNFRSSALTADDDDALLYGQPSTKKIFARWIPFGGLATANRVNDIQLGRFLTAPRHFTWQVFRRGNASPTMGEGVRVTGGILQTATGELEVVPVQIIRVEPRDDVFVVEAEEMRFVQFDSGDLTVRSIIIDTNAYGLNVGAMHDALYPPAGTGDEVQVTVNAGVTVGSTSSGVPALDIGSWPTRAQTADRSNGSPVLTGLSVNTSGLKAGMFVSGTGIQPGSKILSVDSSSQITLDKNATSNGTGFALTVYVVIIKLFLNGRLQGKGGNGGKGGDSNGNSSMGPNSNGKPGENGGTALYTRYPITITWGAGAKIWGGGGGGGGGAGGGNFWDNYSGGGGGGGAGSVPGLGGARGQTEGTAQNGQNATTEAKGSGGYDGSYRIGANGGDPGQPGSDAAVTGAAGNGGYGGAAGSGIDGVSLVAHSGTTAILGPQIN